MVPKCSHEHGSLQISRVGATYGMLLRNKTNFSFPHDGDDLKRQASGACGTQSQ